MTERKTTAGDFDLVQFQALVETFGADHQRWPERSRGAAQGFLIESAAAKRALAQARALDRVLTSETGTSGSANANSALIERIVAAARQQPEIVAVATPRENASGVVVPLQDRRPFRTNRSQPSNQVVRRSANWQIASALAASLILGMALGSLDEARTPLRGLYEVGRGVRIE